MKTKHLLAWMARLGSMGGGMVTLDTAAGRKVRTGGTQQFGEIAGDGQPGQFSIGCACN